jgi:tetratricopeptide (TPR) repeat protein
MMEHLDGLTHWLYAVRGLAADQLASAASHLSACLDCSDSQLQVRKLDAGLRELAVAAWIPSTMDEGFEPTDPFRRRPQFSGQPRKTPRLSRVDSAEALAATERATARSEAILAASRSGGEPTSPLQTLSLQSLEHRFALLYALQEAGRQSAENPISTKKFAEQTIDWLRRQRPAPTDPELGESLVPRLMLRAHAHLLQAITLLWLKEFSRARAHSIVAYRSFARAGAQEISFALVEFVESQRRSLSGEGRTALALARRARETFESHGMEDYAARAVVTEALAHDAVGDFENAVSAFRSALPIFERYELWSNYVGALNGAASSLIRLGKFEDARRDYARALRRFSQERHRYWLGYLRIGLAEALFAADRFSEAALAASRAESVFEKAGLRAHQLIALLLEVESWARHGNLERARQRLDLFRREVERDHALDPAVQRELIAALSGTNPDYQTISTLRHQAGDLLEERYRPARA